MEDTIKIHDLMDLSFYGALKAEKGRVLFVKADIDEKEDAYHFNLMESQPSGLRQLTYRNSLNAFQIFDADHVVFLEPENGEAENGMKIMMLDLQGGEPYTAGLLPSSDFSIAKVLDDSTLLLVRTESIAAGPILPDYEVLDESPWYFNGQGFINKKRGRLYTYDLKEKKLSDCLSTGYDVSRLALGDGKVYFTGHTEGERTMIYEGLYVLDLQAGSIEQLLPSNQYSIYDLVWMNHSLYAFLSDNSRYGLNENPQLYRYSFEEHKMELAMEWDECIGNTVGTDCAVVGGNALCVYKDVLYFTSTIVDHNVLYSFDGKAHRQVVAFDGTIHSFGVNDEGIYFIGAHANELQQLYFCHGDTIEKLSHFNPQVDEKYVAKARPVFYPGWNGHEQMGWVLYPYHFDPNKKYPGILDVHGGPKTVYGPIFYHEMQVWASLGYFVFFANPFGSDGQGNEYSWMRGRYGTEDFKNLMDFTDAVLKAIPQIDPARLGVTGGSYGGFMTNWIIGHTDRFAAAASQRSISNWISFLGTSDIGPEFTRDQQGCGLENIEQLWDHSPLKYVNNVKTPTLFIHSDEDYRCPLEQGLQMLNGVLEQKVPARMCMFRKENHELSRSGKPSHRIRRLQEITDWMMKYAPANE